VRSVGLPEFELDGVDAPVPAAAPDAVGRPWIPITGIAAIGFAVLSVLSMLDTDDARAFPVSDDTTTSAPPTSAAIDVQGEADAPQALLTDQPPINDALSLANLGSGASAAIDRFPRGEIFANEDGFGRVARFDTGSRAFVFSATGTVWGSNSSATLDHGMNVAAIETTPTAESGVVIFRSIDGFVFTRELGENITIPSLTQAQIDELVVGSGVAYATIAEPTFNGGKYAVLRITLTDEFAVESIDLDDELGGERNFERLRDGVVLPDGRIVSIASDRSNSTAALVALGPDGLVEIDLDETNALNLLRTTALRARGTELVAIERGGQVYTKRPDQGGFVPSTLPVDPALSKSRNGVLASIELRADQTLVRIWRSTDVEPIEISLNFRIDPVELVALNETEALLETTTTDGERWLIGVPFANEPPNR